MDVTYLHLWNESTFTRSQTPNSLTEMRGQGLLYCMALIQYGARWVDE